jgi:peptidylprolyl isomerase
MLLRKLTALLAALLIAAPAAAQVSPAYAPPPPPTPENIWYLDLSTGGRVAIQLRPDIAPNHVERIRTLTRRGFYDGLVFHRVIEGFMAQSGDPQGTGAGGSDLPNVAAEISGLPHLRGSVAMARAQGDMNSANSQFYIMLGPGLALDRQYTVFGRVLSGMSFVDAIARGAPPGNPTRIVRASIGSDNVAQLPAEQLRAARAPPPPAPLPPRVQPTATIPPGAPPPR